VTRKVLRHGPFAPFRHWPPIPLPRRQGRSPSRDALRGAGGRTQGALQPLCAFLPLGLRLGGRPLGIGIKLSINSCRKGDGFMLLVQTLA
jgi:hypothetical protein